MIHNDIEIWQQGIVRDSTLKPYNRPLFDAVLKHYTDKEVEICIRKKKKAVTAETHAYYRGVVLPCCLGSETFGGWKIADIHKFLAAMFLKDIEVKEVKGKIRFREITLSTATISMEMMWQYIEEVREYLSTKHGIVTPDPENK